VNEKVCCLSLVLHACCDVSSFEVCILVIGLRCLVSGASKGREMLSGDRSTLVLKTVD